MIASKFPKLDSPCIFTWAIAIDLGVGAFGSLSPQSSLQDVLAASVFAFSLSALVVRRAADWRRPPESSDEHLRPLLSRMSANVQRSRAGARQLCVRSVVRLSFRTFSCRLSGVPKGSTNQYPASDRHVVGGICGGVDRRSAEASLAIGSSFSAHRSARTGDDSCRARPLC